MSRLLATALVVCAFSARAEEPAPPSAMEKSTAPAPDGKAGEALSTVAGEGDGYVFVHGKAVLDAPLRAVLDALKDPDVVVSRRRMASWRKRPAPDVASAFVLEQTVDAIVDVSFEQTWTSTVTSGTSEKPQAALVTSRKTSGSFIVRALDDAIVARQTADGRTLLELVRHQNILHAGIDDALEWMRDMFASLKAKVHGAPLPAVH